MTTYMGVPEEYKVYMYSALGVMFGGVILLIASLFDMNELLLAASLTAITCGFFISIVLAGFFIRKKKKDRNVEIFISTLARILLLIAFAFSTYLIVFSVFFMINNLEQLSAAQWINVAIASAIAVPIVVIGLLAADIIFNKRRKKKKEQEEQDEKLQKEFEELDKEE